jgi:hypothetical protein
MFLFKHGACLGLFLAQHIFFFKKLKMFRFIARTTDLQLITCLARFEVLTVMLLRLFLGCVVL